MSAFPVPRNRSLTAALAVTALVCAPHAIAHQDMPQDASVEPGAAVGTVSFKADCSPAAAAAFDRGLALMHHMMYEQARGEFEAIAASAPDCAMAHWGVASTLFQPLWGTTPSGADIQRGREAIAQARETVGNDRERLLVEATAAFFEPESDRLWDRLPGWIQGMEAAWQNHGEDPDVAALYALSLLAEAQRADDRQSLHDEAESILRAVWEAEPTHPGAVHYTIHATDADGRAANAPEIVASYGEIAPEVPHALHMPSHIYVRLGDWPAVIDWNTRSAEVALKHTVAGAVSFHYVHAIDYLVYGHLQRGEDSVAEAILGKAMEAGPHQANFPGAFHLAAMPARLAVERRDWAAARSIKPRAPDYIAWDAFHWPEGLSRFATGLGAVFTGDLGAARAAEQRLAELAKAAESAADARFAVYIEVDRRILAGWIAHAEGRDDRAVELMRSAGALEAGVEKHPVSPGTLYPPNEALGDLLLALERPEDALVAYRASDRMWPGRYNTLFGALQAARQSGEDGAASEWAARLVEVAPNAERTTIREARGLAGG